MIVTGATASAYRALVAAGPAVVMVARDDMLALLENAARAPVVTIGVVWATPTGWVGP